MRPAAAPVLMVNVVLLFLSITSTINQWSNSSWTAIPLVGSWMTGVVATLVGIDIACSLVRTRSGCLWVTMAAVVAVAAGGSGAVPVVEVWSRTWEIQGAPEAWTIDDLHEGGDQPLRVSGTVRLDTLLPTGTDSVRVLAVIRQPLRIRIGTVLIERYDPLIIPSNYRARPMGTVAEALDDCRGRCFVGMPTTQDLAIRNLHAETVVRKLEAAVLASDFDAAVTLDKSIRTTFRDTKAARESWPLLGLDYDKVGGSFEHPFEHLQRSSEAAPQPGTLRRVLVGSPEEVQAFREFDDAEFDEIVWSRGAPDENSERSFAPGVVVWEATRGGRYPNRMLVQDDIILWVGPMEIAGSRDWPVPTRFIDSSNCSDIDHGGPFLADGTTDTLKCGELVVGHTAGGAADTRCPAFEGTAQRIYSLELPKGSTATATLLTPCAALDLAVLRSGTCSISEPTPFPHRLLDVTNGDSIRVRALRLDAPFILQLDCETKAPKP